MENTSSIPGVFAQSLKLRGLQAFSHGLVRGGYGSENLYAPRIMRTHDAHACRIETNRGKLLSREGCRSDSPTFEAGRSCAWVTSMLNEKKIVIVMPAYNAALTLDRTYSELPLEIVDEVILVDDGSSDGTVVLASNLGLTVFRHKQNLGYGRNQ